jgi:hypothetical protein
MAARVTMTDYNTSLDLIARLVQQFRINRTAYHAPVSVDES